MSICNIFNLLKRAYMTANNTHRQSTPHAVTFVKAILKFKISTLNSIISKERNVKLYVFLTRQGSKGNFLTIIIDESQY